MSTQENNKIVCEECHKKTQKELPAQDGTSSKGMKCEAPYQAVTECMNRHNLMLQNYVALAGEPDVAREVIKNYNNSNITITNNNTTNKTNTNNRSNATNNSNTTNNKKTTNNNTTGVPGGVRGNNKNNWEKTPK